SRTTRARASANLPTATAVRTALCTACSPSPAPRCAAAAAPLAPRRRPARPRRAASAARSNDVRAQSQRTVTEFQVDPEAGLRVDVRDERATITLNRPERLNSQTPLMWTELI